MKKGPRREAGVGAFRVAAGMRHLMALLLGLAAQVALAARAAEVLAITPIEQSVAVSASPSLSLHWTGRDARAVLIYIPAGEGRMGLLPGHTDHRYPFHQMLRRLSDPTFTRGRLDVVLLDSPAPLSPGLPSPAARQGRDHLVRIESAIRFYRERTGLPVWLMGHSNGSISLAAFAAYAQDKGITGLVAGMVVSGSRGETQFRPPVAWPMLFLHHREDGCDRTPPQAAWALYQQVRGFNPAPTEFVFIQGGRFQGGWLCTSGFHVYHGAEEELTRAIDEFLARFHP
jgi:hypothetical protein